MTNWATLCPGTTMLMPTGVNEFVEQPTFPSARAHPRPAAVTNLDSRIRRQLASLITTISPEIRFEQLAALSRSAAL